MKSQVTEKHPQTSSFFFGLLIGAAGLYLIGTKQGRKILTKVMESAEELEKSGDSLMEEIQTKLNDEFEVESLLHHVLEKEKRKDESESVSNMHSVMERIKSVIPVREVKKYVSKDGKIVK